MQKRYTVTVMVELNAQNYADAAAVVEERLIFQHRQGMEQQAEGDIGTDSYRTEVTSVSVMSHPNTA